MRTSRLLPVVLATALLVTLTACDPSSGSPTPLSTSAAPVPTDVVTATPVPIEAGTVRVTVAGISVSATDGASLTSLDYAMDAAAAAAQLATALGAEPVVVVTPPANPDSGCQTEQTTYDFGGLVLRSPGFIGTAGSFEAVVTGAATSGGVAIELAAGQRIGGARAAFESAVADELVLSDGGSSAYLGFDIVNPGEPEEEHIGALARFDGGSLAQVNTPFLVYADC